MYIHITGKYGVCNVGEVLFLFVWILTNCSSVSCVLIFFGMSRLVKVMLCLMYVSSPPPRFTTLSMRMGV